MLPPGRDIYQRHRGNRGGRNLVESHNLLFCVKARSTLYHSWDFPHLLSPFWNDRVSLTSAGILHLHWRGFFPPVPDLKIFFLCNLTSHCFMESGHTKCSISTLFLVGHYLPKGSAVNLSLLSSQQCNPHFSSLLFWFVLASYSCEPLWIRFWHLQDYLSTWFLSLRTCMKHNFASDTWNWSRR